jgi:SAM-dependent methyltransferase
MAHLEQKEFVVNVKKQFPEYFTNKKVLEVGSLDINGNTRSKFKNCEYTGIDVAAGPNVDVVCQGQDFDAADNTYDVVISCEVMEHNPHWLATMQNMTRVCKDNGLIIMSCATVGRKEHGTARTDPESSPLTVELGWNYYLNLTEQDFIKENATQGMQAVFWTYWKSFDLYMVGFKGKGNDALIKRVEELKKQYEKMHWNSIKAIRRKLKHQIGLIR